jgi:hypothetical protein
MDWSKVIASESKTRAIIRTDDYARKYKLSIRSVHLPLDTYEFVLSELDRTRLLEYAKRYPVQVENEILRLLAHMPNSTKQSRDLRYVAPAHVER